MAGSAKMKQVEGAKTGIMYRFTPSSVRVIAELNSRGKLPEKDAIEEMKASILGHGQLAPVRFRWAEDEDCQKYENVNLGTPLIIAGQTRALAVQELAADDPEAGFMLDALPIKQGASELEQFLISWAENLQRNNPDPISMARGIQKLKAQGLNEQQIANESGKSLAWVQETERLLDLDPSIRKRVASGEIPWSTARTLVREETKEAQVAIIEDLEQRGEKITRDNIDDAKRRRAERSKPKAEKEETSSDGEAGDPASAIGPRSAVQVGKYFAEIVESEPEDSILGIVAGLIVQFRGGSLTDRQMDNRLKKYLGAVKWDSAQGKVKISA